MHLTLKFFGETPLGKIEPIVFAVEKALRNVGMFELKMENIGIFGSHYQPKLIWAGVSNSEELKPLWDNIRLQLETIGYQSDRQNFVPHLTLGRIRKLSDKSLFQNIIEKHSKMKLQKVVVDKVILFESVLKKTGPTYNIIDEFSLKT
jgi:2'-5' RNA ligase